MTTDQTFQNDRLTLKLIELAFREDSLRGDITTEPLNSEKICSAEIKAKEPLVICGTEIIKKVFTFNGVAADITVGKKDGESVPAGTVLAKISSSAGNLLLSERIALNFFQRMSGIATLTSEYVSCLFPKSVTKITDTRKTTPGWRMLEKYAVKTGGGKNHRFGLDDGILIKDNHIALAGSIKKAVEIVQQSGHHLSRIEVETSNRKQVAEALETGCDIIMLDNMSDEEVESCINLINGAALVEVSGGITKERIPQLSRMNVDFISIGALTHSSTSKDISMSFN